MIELVNVIWKYCDYPERKVYLKALVDAPTSEIWVLDPAEALHFGSYKQAHDVARRLKRLNPTSLCIVTAMKIKPNRRREVNL